MSWNDDDYRRREQRHEEERRYQGDVTYDVWRSGGNVDHIDRDRVSDAFRDGDPYESAARREIRAHTPRLQDADCDPEPEPNTDEETR